MLTETDFLKCLNAANFLELLLKLLDDSFEFTHRFHETTVGMAMTSPAVTIGAGCGFRRDHGGIPQPRRTQHAGRGKRRQIAWPAVEEGFPGRLQVKGVAVSLREYFSKMKGSTRGSPPRVSNEEILWSWIGGFLRHRGSRVDQPSVFRGTRPVADDRFVRGIGGAGYTARCAVRWPSRAT